MDIEAGFLEDMRQDPDSDTAFLVYADWLEDHVGGDERRARHAELIRLQVALGRAWPDYPGCVVYPTYHYHTASLPPHLHHLAAQAERARDLVRQVFDPRAGHGFRSWTVQRGMPRSLHLVYKLMPKTPWWFERYPITDLRLYKVRWKCSELARLAHLRPLRTLCLGGVVRDDLEQLCDSPHLQALRHLQVNQVGVQEILLLLERPWLQPVTALDIEIEKPPRPDGTCLQVLAPVGLNRSGAISRLVRPEAMRSLRRLYLHNRGLTLEDVRALARCPAFERLEELGLVCCGLDDAYMLELVKAPWLGRLHTLDLVLNPFTDAGTFALPGRLDLTRLRHLTVSARFQSPRALARLREELGDRLIVKPWYY